MRIRKLLNQVLQRYGYHLVKAGGQFPFEDIASYVGNTTSPVIFDVGANTGQSLQTFKEKFPASTVHSFEPGPETYKELQQTVAKYRDAFAWNLALGSSNARQTLIEHNFAATSSFLEVGTADLGIPGWDEVKSRTAVDVVTMDEFCRRESIAKIDILKSDTQGYDFEVLKGAQTLLSQGKVELIFVEVNFSDMYSGTEPFEKLCDFLSSHHYVLVHLYPVIRRKYAFWTDALFAKSDNPRLPAN